MAVRLTIKELRTIVREAMVAGSDPNEAYNHDLTDDPSFKKKSVLVPDDIKASVSSWSRKMGLSGKKKRKAAS